MKARIRKTGEVVDVISFGGDIEKRGPYDWVSYIDSEGKEHSVEKSMNYYWDFERIPEVNTDFIQIDWEHRRYEIAKEAIRGVALNCDEFTQSEIECTVKNALSIADALIAALKKRKED